MKRIFLAVMVTLALTMARPAPAQHYAPTWESIDKRPTPPWFDDAKFGIFIHWGVYSVPAFADPHSKVGESYAEWYWNHMQDKNGPTWAFHLAALRRQLQVPGFCRPVQGRAVRSRTSGPICLQIRARATSS